MNRNFPRCRAASLPPRVGQDNWRSNRGLQVILHVGKGPSILMERGEDGGAAYRGRAPARLNQNGTRRSRGCFHRYQGNFADPPQPGVSGFGSQQVGIVRGVSGSSQTPAHAVSNGGHGGHTGLPRQQEQAEQRGHDAHGMPPDKAHSGPTRSPGCVHRFFRRLCALIGRRLCLLLKLPFLPLLPPQAGLAFYSARVLLSSPLEW